ncbi:MAG: hypothetical protein AAFU68_02795 [Pseudomonadota bacterium]
MSETLKPEDMPADMPRSIREQTWRVVFEQVVLDLVRAGETEAPVKRARVIADDFLAEFDKGPLICREPRRCGEHAPKDGGET